MPNTNNKIQKPQEFSEKEVKKMRQEVLKEIEKKEKEKIKTKAVKKKAVEAKKAKTAVKPKVEPAAKPKPIAVPKIQVIAPKVKAIVPKLKPVIVPLKKIKKVLKKKSKKKPVIKKGLEPSPPPIYPVKKIEEKKTKKIKKKSKLLLVVIIILLLLVVALVVFGIGLYRFNWDNKLTKTITDVIPYPAAVVNYKILPYSEYTTDVKTLEYFYSKQTEVYPETPTPNSDEIKTMVIEKMIRNEITGQLAKKYDVETTVEEVEGELEKIINEVGSREEVEQVLENLYQWTTEDFKREILRPSLLAMKVDQAITEDLTLTSEVRDKAQGILDDIKQGKISFEEAAQNFSQDGTAAQGGDLGYFAPEQMIPEFTQALTALEPGQMSDLVKTRFGYHIIKMEDKILDEDGNIQQVRARHIIIKFKDFNTYLEEEMEKAKIWRLVK